MGPVIFTDLYNIVIIFRYLAREVLISMVAISGVLLLIFMSNRFIKYLAQAVSGRLAAEVLLAIMGYRLPSFLELILPFGLIIAIVLVYGRLYMESEMTVLSACGMSQRRLLTYTLAPAVLVALLVGTLSLYISPLSVKKVEDIYNEQRQRTEFESLVAGRFQPMRGGESVTYAENMSGDSKHMYEVFIAEMAGESSASQEGGLAVMLARSGKQIMDPVTGQRYLILQDGFRYQGRPGQVDYRVMRFEEYAQRLEPPKNFEKFWEVDAIPTLTLWDSKWPAHKAALHWRFSMPLVVLVVVIAAVPLSKTNPRQGRYAKLLPAVLFYIFYVVALSSAREKIKDGDLQPVGMWVMHLPFLLIALLLMCWDFMRRRLTPKPPATPPTDPDIHREAGAALNVSLRGENAQT